MGVGDILQGAVEAIERGLEIGTRIAPQVQQVVDIFREPEPVVIRGPANLPPRSLPSFQNPPPSRVETGTRSAPQLGGSPVAFQGSPLQQALQEFGLTGGGGNGMGSTMALIRSPFRPTAAGASAQLFVVPNPVTGRPTWFRPAGRPVLFSGDFAAARRVSKVAGRARRRRPR